MFVRQGVPLDSCQSPLNGVSCNAIKTLIFAFPHNPRIEFIQTLLEYGAVMEIKEADQERKIVQIDIKQKNIDEIVSFIQQDVNQTYLIELNEIRHCLLFLTKWAKMPNLILDHSSIEIARNVLVKWKK